MRILHITPSIGPLSYGLGQVVLNLAKEQSLQNHDVKIWCYDSKETIMLKTEEYSLPEDSICSFKPFGPKILGLSLSLIKKIMVKEDRFDILHQHGIWTGISYVTNTYSKRNHIPYIVAPHGSLEPNVLKKSYIKKRIASYLYENKNLKEASLLHATSHNEIESFRLYGLKNPISYITNGISTNWLESKGDKAGFCDKYDIPTDKKVLLFMSRIAPKKGLIMLLEAWSKVTEKYNDWILLIIGGDEDGHKQEVTNKIENLKINNTVKIMNPIFGEGKRDAFDLANLFILPSYSEGFPMVVLDSLGAGVPAIVTKASDWSELDKEKCGWWVEANTTSIIKVLDEALNYSVNSLATMGFNGKNLVRTKYNWHSISLNLIRVYTFLLTKINEPVNIFYTLD